MQRKDLTNLNTFSIDPAETTDVDDAFSIIKTTGTDIILYVHIADVSSDIPENSDLDMIAQKETETLYLNKVTHMLGKSTPNFSLLQDKIRNAVTTEIKINRLTGAVELLPCFLSIIINRHKLSYDVNINDFNYVKTLYFAGQAIFNKNPNFQELRRTSDYDIHKCIEVFMILTNNFMGNTMITQPYSILRVHNKPANEINAKMNEINYRAKLFYDKNFIYREAENSYVRKYYNNLIKMAKNMAIGSAKYALFETDSASKSRSHLGLASENYTHFTSPIRRYADILVHRIVLNTNTRTKTELNNILEHINSKKKIIKKLYRKDMKSKIVEKNGKYQVHIIGKYLRPNRPYSYVVYGKFTDFEVVSVDSHNNYELFDWLVLTIHKGQFKLARPRLQTH